MQEQENIESCAAIERLDYRDHGPALHGGSAGKHTQEQLKPAAETHKTPKPISKKTPDLGTHKNGKLSGRSGGAKISCPLLRLDINLRYVGPPV